MFGHLELNSFVKTLEEFKEGCKKYPSHLRVLDVFILFGMLLALLQVFYSVLCNAQSFQSFISSICCEVGFSVLVLSLRLHLTHFSDEVNSDERTFVEFILCLTVLFFFV
jgi:oligosaccharyltransferase complex subunit epsilon